MCVSMKKNKIIISESIVLDVLDGKTKRVIIDGKEIDTLDEFFRVMAREFQLPDDCRGNINGFIDWMRDLWHLNCDTIELIIKNQKYFIASYPQMREVVYSIFEKYILPWWEKDVVLYCVGGETKKFTVYFVDVIHDSDNLVDK